MKIALIQQHATDDKAINIQRGLDNIDTAAANGAECAMFAELTFTRFFPQYHADTSNRIESEFIPGTTSNLFCEKAKKHNMVIITNLFEQDGNDTYDSSPVLYADGTILGATRMIHITEYDCFMKRIITLPEIMVPGCMKL